MVRLVFRNVWLIFRVDNMNQTLKRKRVAIKRLKPPEASKLQLKKLRHILRNLLQLQTENHFELTDMYI